MKTLVSYAVNMLASISHQHLSGSMLDQFVIKQHVSEEKFVKKCWLSFSMFYKRWPILAKFSSVNGIASRFIILANIGMVSGCLKIAEKHFLRNPSK